MRQMAIRCSGKSSVKGGGDCGRGESSVTSCRHISRKEASCEAVIFYEQAMCVCVCVCACVCALKLAVGSFLLFSQPSKK